MSPGGLVLRATVALAGAAVAVAGVASWLSAPTPSAGDAPSAAAPAARVDGGEVRLRGPAAAGAPVAAALPALGVEADVVPLRMTGTALVPPADPGVLGWWRGGAAPGDGAGAVLVTGHNSTAGGAVLGELGTSRPGDRVVLRTGDGRAAYVVDRVVDLTRAQFRDRAASLLGATGPERLVLVTCGGFDGTVWTTSTVVVARRA